MTKRGMRRNQRISQQWLKPLAEAAVDKEIDEETELELEIEHQRGIP